jgi:hypothetical protein
VREQPAPVGPDGADVRGRQSRRLGAQWQRGRRREPRGGGSALGARLPERCHRPPAIP